MIETLAAIALAAHQPAPRDPADCRPRRHLLRSAPPPPAFSISRYEGANGERIHLSAYRCPDGVNWRVSRLLETGSRSSWVQSSACPAIVGWIEQAERLPIPSPALAPFPETPRGATWFVLASRSLAGGVHMEITFVERPEGPPNAIAAWAREGDAVFARCGPTEGWVN